MRRTLVALAAAGLLVVSGIGVAAADHELGTNPGREEHSVRSGNPVAVCSATFTHNGKASTLGQGGDPSHGARGSEIQALQQERREGNTVCQTN